jgi:hypothetical protein
MKTASSSYFMKIADSFRNAFGKIKETQGYFILINFSIKKKNPPPQSFLDL